MGLEWEIFLFLLHTPSSSGGVVGICGLIYEHHIQEICMAVYCLNLYCGKRAPEKFRGVSVVYDDGIGMR